MRKRQRYDDFAAVIVWKRQMDKVLGFVVQLDSSPSIHGQKWITKMRAHYKERLTELLSQAPPGSKPFIQGYKMKIDKL